MKVKKGTKLATLALLCIFAAASVLSIASAADAQAANVITTDISGGTTKVTQFSPGQTVYIPYSIEAGKTAIISAIDENGNPVQLFDGTNYVTSAVVSGSGQFTMIPPHPGYYYINVNGKAQIQIAQASFFVLPESAFGALAALGTGIAAFGIIKVKKIKIF
jgi:hypothetical protein